MSSLSLKAILEFHVRTTSTENFSLRGSGRVTKVYKPHLGFFCVCQSHYVASSQGSAFSQRILLQLTVDQMTCRESFCGLELDNASRLLVAFVHQLGPALQVVFVFSSWASQFCFHSEIPAACYQLRRAPHSLVETCTLVRGCSQERV